MKLLILIVNFNSSNFLKQFYFYQFKYQNEIHRNNIRINLKFNKSKNNLVLNYNKKNYIQLK